MPFKCGKNSSDLIATCSQECTQIENIKIPYSNKMILKKEKKDQIYKALLVHLKLQTMLRHIYTYLHCISGTYRHEIFLFTVLVRFLVWKVVRLVSLGGQPFQATFMKSAYMRPVFSSFSSNVSWPNFCMTIRGSEYSNSSLWLRPFNLLLRWCSLDRTLSPIFTSHSFLEGFIHNILCSALFLSLS